MSFCDRSDTQRIGFVGKILTLIIKPLYLSAVHRRWTLSSLGLTGDVCSFGSEGTKHICNLGRKKTNSKIYLLETFL